MQKQLNIPYSLEGQPDITDIRDINESFATGTLKIMYLGENRNGSAFSKEVVEKALPSLYNVPIVANYDREADEIGGHDIDVVEKDDDFYLVNITQPCGVIPEHARFHFESVFDSSGLCHEYLVADDVILWKRQEVYDVIMNRYNGNISHSMEIQVNEGNIDIKTGVLNIEDFTFTALCLLGNCEPCFEGSALAINQQMFSLQFAQMMKEMKETFANLNKQSTFDEDEIDKDAVKGGEEMTDEIKDLETEEVAEEVVDEPVDAEEVKKEEDDTVTTVIDEPEVMPEEEAIETGIAEDAYATLEPMMADKNYWLLGIDWDKETDEFKVTVQSKDDHRAYALMAKSGEEGYSVDWENRIAKAYMVVDADTPLAYADLPGTVEILKANQEFSTKVVEFEEQLNSIGSELEELRAFKAEIENAEAEAAREELFSKFTDLEGIEEFEALKEKAGEYDLETLEEKLYAIRGRNVRTDNFSIKRQVGVKLGVGSNHKVENSPYGNLFKKFKVEEE